MPSRCEVCGGGKTWWARCRVLRHKHYLCTPCRRYLVETAGVPHRRGREPRCPDTVTNEDRVALGLPVEREAS